MACTREARRGDGDRRCTSQCVAVVVRGAVGAGRNGDGARDRRALGGGSPGGAGRGGGDGQRCPLTECRDGQPGSVS
ncbi:hypothetical protein B8W73_16170 [Arthrobacter agilis]|nr:hypothetical protein B8W73_16170 [Arthrobacter agilis]